MPRRVPILARLLAATLIPALATFAAFGLLAHYMARRALEDELGRRLSAVAAAAALAVRGERVDLLGPGDEGSRTFRNARRKLEELRLATGSARVYLFDPAGTSRVDTEEGVPIGARYNTLEADRVELDRALAGEAVSSVLFTGRDGRLYKTGFAPLRDEAGTIVGAVAVDGSAELYGPLAGLRRIVFVTSGAGALAAVLLAVLAARRITRPLRQLEGAARRIGEGQLDRLIEVTSPDEIGFLAGTLETMRRQLRARDERLQMMLAGIAHEVRNPLAGMELFAGLLREDLAGDEERLGHVRRIERELGHLKTVVTEFLEYARRPRPELRPGDAADVLREVHQVLEAEASARPGVRLSLGTPETAPVRCDPMQLRRALLNLGKNALQALGEGGGEVSLTCALDGAEVRLAVRDSGPGVPAEVLPRLFTPFFTTREKGTGLGLAFVAEIARDHGGRVSVESAAGRGATFTLALPLYSAIGPSSAAPAPPAGDDQQAVAAAGGDANGAR